VTNEDPEPTTLGGYLRLARDHHRLTLRNVEQITGVPRDSLSRLENDRTERPDPLVLNKLADAYQLDVADLFAFNGVTPADKLPSLAPYLRARYGHLPPEAIAEANRRLQDLLDSYDKKSR
jgi:transcriptional regulator with XRE-family HTH domain